jgi:exopolysaccharide biosynthesis polyprenyl glycosylphosphotransferase
MVMMMRNVKLIFVLIDFLTPVGVLLLVEAVWLDSYVSALFVQLGIVIGILSVLVIKLLNGYDSYYPVSAFTEKIRVVFRAWFFVVLASLGYFYVFGSLPFDKLYAEVLLFTAIVAPFMIVLERVLVVRLWLRVSPPYKVLLLGDDYDFSELEMKRLESQNITIENFGWDELERFLTYKDSSEQPNALLLNMTTQVKDGRWEKEITSLELKKVYVYSMEAFFEKFLRKCYVPKLNEGLVVLQGVHPYSRAQYFVKRFVDYIISVILIVFAIPILLYTFFRIYRESGLPVLFRQERVGIGAKGFVLIKFRSMYLDAEKNGAQFAQKNDPRVFPFGATIRKSRIDEIPQLFNVLKGDLHLVGPRPERQVFTEKLEQKIAFYNERHIVRPGVTGWAQVMYPYGANEEDARQKLMYDLFYIKNWSIWLELETIIRTIEVVILRKGV